MGNKWKWRSDDVAMPRKSVEKGFASDWVSEELFVGFFSEHGVCSSLVKKGLARTHGIGGRPDGWHPPVEYITSENTIFCCSHFHLRFLSEIYCLVSFGLVLALVFKE